MKYSVSWTHMRDAEVVEIHAEYLKKLSQIEGKLPTLNVRIFPASFDPDEPALRAFPRSLTWKWDSLTEHLQARSAVGVIMRLPLLWQVEPLVFDACQAAKAFVFVNDAGNMPVGRSAIQSASINTVVTTSDDAALFAAHLAEHNVPLPPNWFVVYPLAASSHAIPEPLKNKQVRVAREIHIFPGIPLFVQCPSLVENHRDAFHSADGFTLTHVGEKIFVHGTPHDTVPLTNYSLSITVHPDPTPCPCGKLLYTL